MTSSVVIETAVAIVSLVDEGYLSGLQSSRVLAHPLRRRIVSILLDRDTIQREELAAVLAADETLPRDDSERTEITLHHDHLPRLADELLIEYDQRNGDIRLWKDPESAADLLESSYCTSPQSGAGFAILVHTDPLVRTHAVNRPLSVVSKRTW